MSNWIIFAVFVTVGLADLVIGIAFSRTADLPVGTPPPADGRSTPRAKRLLGRTMMLSALLLWALAGAFASGLLGPDFALPIFARSVE